eukprot:4838806-Lingulodinium_polyedra.AAC.1
MPGSLPGRAQWLNHSRWPPHALASCSSRVIHARTACCSDLVTCILYSPPRPSSPWARMSG